MGAFFIVKLLRANEAIRQAIDQVEGHNWRLQHEILVKNQLLSVLSHDLRAPLRSGLTMLQRIDATHLDHSSLSFLSDQIKGARILVENAVAWVASSQENLEITRSETQPSVLAGAVIRLFQPSLAHANLSIENRVSPALHIKTDPWVLESIFRNLISNAIRFAPPGTVIKIEAAEPCEKHCFDISSEGSIRDPDLIREVLACHKTLLNGRANCEQGGMGLALSSQMARLLGGELSLVRADAQGSTFRVALPIS